MHREFDVSFTPQSMCVCLQGRHHRKTWTAKATLWEQGEMDRGPPLGERWSSDTALPNNASAHFSEGNDENPDSQGV